jgi:hypothetical protein
MSSASEDAKNASRGDWSACGLPVVLPELTITPTHMQIFMFSAATWNRHHIHYSRDAAIREVCLTSSSSA